MSDVRGESSAGGAAKTSKTGRFLGSLKDALVAASRDDAPVQQQQAVAVPAVIIPPAPQSPSAEEAVRLARAAPMTRPAAALTVIEPERHIEFESPPTTRVVRAMPKAAESPKPDRTVLEEGLDTPQRVTEQFVRTVLGSFLFRGDDVFKKVGVLSGGEKSRLALVKLLLDPPNFLLMDEPTTHLDMPSIDALVGALQQFEGTVVFISHDVYFIRAIAKSVVHVNAGKLTNYAGDYQYYLDRTSATSARE